MQVVTVVEGKKWVIVHHGETYDVVSPQHAVFSVYAGPRLLTHRQSLAAVEAFIEGRYAVIDEYVADVEAETAPGGEISFDLEMPLEFIPRITIRDHADQHILHRLLTGTIDAGQKDTDEMVGVILAMKQAGMLTLAAMLNDQMDQKGHMLFELARLADEVALIHDASPEADVKMLPDTPRPEFPYGLHVTADEQAACKYC